MSQVDVLFSVFASAGAGACVGFGAGLVPGLHMNNIAAALTAYAGTSLALFGALGEVVGSDFPELTICCFISSAMVAHLFAESITSTYIGIPAGDVVSVLPAHKMAQAGLGRIAVRSSADGSLAGVLLSMVLLLPICLLMGRPIQLYSILREIMGFVIITFSVVMLVYDGSTLARFARAASLFLASGILGSVVLMSDFNASSIPDVPWIHESYVQKSSLLLPLFAGLFGIPSLIMSLGSRSVFDVKRDVREPSSSKPGPKDYVLSLLGGAVVGWLPGMTSGASATLCSPRLRETDGESEIESSARFIWSYSFVSASGAVFALGALLVIMRARSGSMDAVQLFLGGSLVVGDLEQNLTPFASLLLSMLVAACISRFALKLMDPGLQNLHRTLCSRQVALLSMLFVCALSIGLTGVRGSIVLLAAVCLGLLPTRIGVRRIQLMGCLLVPIALGFFMRT